MRPYSKRLYAWQDKISHHGKSFNSIEEEETMNLKDLFVPRYLNSDPKVRMQVARNSDDIKLLQSMAEKDTDAEVRKVAAERAEMLRVGQHQTA
jgi:hypothetical protein